MHRAARSSLPQVCGGRMELRRCWRDPCPAILALMSSEVWVSSSALFPIRASRSLLPSTRWSEVITDRCADPAWLRRPANIVRQAGKGLRVEILKIVFVEEVAAGDG